MSAIRRILVAIKDPESRQHSNVTKAAQLAQAFDAELVLFHAMAMPVAIEAVLRTQEGFRDFERGELERRLARLESKAERLRRQKIRVKVAAAWDFPVHEAIVRHARRVKADLIVADIHAGPRLAPWLLHLTDWELLRTSPLPVLVVKTLRAWRRPTVLAAIDPRHAFAKPAGLDARILNAGAEFSRALRGTLRVMHAYVPVPGTAIPLIAGSSGALAELAADTEARARQAFQRALRAARIPRSRRHGSDFALRPQAGHDRQHGGDGARRPRLRRARGEAGTLRDARRPRAARRPLRGDIHDAVRLLRRLSPGRADGYFRLSSSFTLPAPGACESALIRNTRPASTWPSPRSASWMACARALPSA
jgi:nucleotide-binding universal stress UspA family protein